MATAFLESPQHVRNRTMGFIKFVWHWRYFFGGPPCVCHSTVQSGPLYTAAPIMRIVGLEPKVCRTLTRVDRKRERIERRGSYGKEVQGLKTWRTRVAHASSMRSSNLWPRVRGTMAGYGEYVNDSPPPCYTRPHHNVSLAPPA